MTVTGADMVSFDITVTAEIAGTPTTNPVPSQTAVLTAFLASGTTTGGWEPIYGKGKPVTLTLSCTREDARRDDEDLRYTNMWSIVARNDDPTGGPHFNTKVTFDIVTDRVIKLIVTPAPKPIF